MPVRIAAIEVGHWHALFDAAYLRTLAHMPWVRIVGVQDPDAAMAVQRNGSLHCTTAAGKRQWRTVIARCGLWIRRTPSQGDICKLRSATGVHAVSGRSPPPDCATRRFPSRD